MYTNHFLFFLNVLLSFKNRKIIIFNKIQILYIGFIDFQVWLNKKNKDFPFFRNHCSILLLDASRNQYWKRSKFKKSELIFLLFIGYYFSKWKLFKKNFERSMYITSNLGDMIFAQTASFSLSICSTLFKW